MDEIHENKDCDKFLCGKKIYNNSEIKKAMLGIRQNLSVNAAFEKDPDFRNLSYCITNKSENLSKKLCENLSKNPKPSNIIMKDNLIGELKFIEILKMIRYKINSFSHLELDFLDEDINRLCAREIENVYIRMHRFENINKGTPNYQRIEQIYRNNRYGNKANIVFDCIKIPLEIELDNENLLIPCEDILELIFYDNFNEKADFLKLFDLTKFSNVILTSSNKIYNIELTIVPEYSFGTIKFNHTNFKFEVNQIKQIELVKSHNKLLEASYEKQQPDISIQSQQPPDISIQPQQNSDTMEEAYGKVSLNKVLLSAYNPNQNIHLKRLKDLLLDTTNKTFDEKTRDLPKEQKKWYIPDEQFNNLILRIEEAFPELKYNKAARPESQSDAAAAWKNAIDRQQKERSYFKHGRGSVSGWFSKKSKGLGGKPRRTKRKAYKYRKTKGGKHKTRKSKYKKRRITYRL